jgi:3-oxoacyl-[acyl-carrier protein] reductase
VIVDADAQAGNAAARELGAIAITADVTDRASVEGMAAAVVERFGHIQILAANAGAYPATEVDRIDDEAWNYVMDLNARGAVQTVQACLPTMREASYGRIVLTSSITGPITGHPGFAVYGASKAAMLGFMRSAAVEFAPSGITINAVMPGNVNTPGLDNTSESHQRLMLEAIPMGRYAEPEEVGWAVRFLASPEAGHITGQTLIVDGGQVLRKGTAEARGAHG